MVMFWPFEAVVFAFSCENPLYFYARQGMQNFIVAIVLGSKCFDLKGLKKWKSQYHCFYLFPVQVYSNICLHNAIGFDHDNFLFTQPSEAAKAHACDTTTPVIQVNKRHHKWAQHQDKTNI